MGWVSSEPFALLARGSTSRRCASRLFITGSGRRERVLLQSALCGETIHAATRRHHDAGRRGGSVATYGACAAAGDAGSRVPWHPTARRNGRPCARIAPGPERNGHFEEHVWRVGDILMWDNRCTLHAHRLQRGRAPPDAASDDPRREAAMSRPQYRLRSSSSVRCPCCRGRCGAASCRTASRPD